MASKQELENQKRNNELIEEQNQLLSDQLKLNKKAVQEQRDISNAIKSQTKDLEFQKQERSELLSIGRSLNKIAQESSNLDTRALGTTKDLITFSKQQVEIQNRINQLKSLEGTIKEGDVEKQFEINQLLELQIKTAEDLSKELKEQQKLSKSIASSFSVKTFSNLSNLVKTLPGLGALSTPFEEAAEASRLTRANQLEELEYARRSRKLDLQKLKSGKELTRDVIKRLGLEKNIQSTGRGAAENYKENQKILKDQLRDLSKVPNGFKAFNAGINALGTTIRRSFGAATIAAIVDEFLLVNKQTVELQKSLALSAGEATDLRQEFAASAASSENINISTTALLETVTALSKQFGFPTLFDKETLITTTKLTKQVGISAESAGMLAASTVTTGKNFEDQYKDALGTSYELQRQEGVQLDLRNILEESGKVTGTIRANLGSNVETIAAAVTQAKLFGGSLDDVANASKALLDFESSITAELEAELLLGKNINLETARQASLNGDMVTVAKELRKEAGDYTEFSKMNVIQQEALAKAMGMQSDQLADILFQQDIQGKTASELRALGKDELADRLEAQTAQEKFNASVAKLKGLLGDVVTAFMPLIDVLSGIFGVISKVIAAIQPLIGFFTGMAAGALVGGIPGAIIGGITGLISDVSKADDAIIPTTGYGDTIIKSGKDTIALNNEDSVAVVAGTNLGGGSNKTGERTNQLLESLIMQNAKKPEISPVGLYEVQ